jgi:hypothetical protein
LHYHVPLDQHVLGHRQGQAGQDEGDDPRPIADGRVVADNQIGRVLDLDPAVQSVAWLRSTSTSCELPM